MTQKQLRQLVERWRGAGAARDGYHATMGVGWKVCADELEQLIEREAGDARAVPAAPPENRSETKDEDQTRDVPSLPEAVRRESAVSTLPARLIEMAHHAANSGSFNMTAEVAALILAVAEEPKRCTDFAPASFSGHWRDWHRGHGCNLDPVLPDAGRAPQEQLVKKTDENFTEAVGVKAACLDCGLPYPDFGLDVLLPRHQWLDLHPAEGGLLCATCLARRAAALPDAVAIHAVIGIVPHRTADAGRAQETKAGKRSFQADWDAASDAERALMMEPPARRRCGAQHPSMAWETCGRWHGHKGPHRAMGRYPGEYDWTDEVAAPRSPHQEQP